MSRDERQIFAPVAAPSTARQIIREMARRLVTARNLLARYRHEDEVANITAVLERAVPYLDGNGRDRAEE